MAHRTPRDHGSLVWLGGLSFRFYLIVWCLLFVPFIWRMFVHSRTRYVFGETAVTRKLNIFFIRRLTVP